MPWAPTSTYLTPPYAWPREIQKAPREWIGTPTLNQARKAELPTKSGSPEPQKWAVNTSVHPTARAMWMEVGQPPKPPRKSNEGQKNVLDPFLSFQMLTLWTQLSSLVGEKGKNLGRGRMALLSKECMEAWITRMFTSERLYFKPKGLNCLK